MLGLGAHICTLWVKLRTQDVTLCTGSKGTDPSSKSSLERLTRTLANPTVVVIQHLGKKSIQTNRDIPDGLRHIIKNVSKRLFRNILSGPCHTIYKYYSGAAVCDKTVAGRCPQRQGGWVGGLPDVLFLPWQLWQEARTTSSILA